MPLDEILSDPAKSKSCMPSSRQLKERGERGKDVRTRFKEPSHASPVILFMPRTRNVKRECDREDRSFIQVVATAQRNYACWRSEATWLGPLSDTVYYVTKVCNSGKRQHALVMTSVTVVHPFLSCLIPRLRLSNSLVPRRTLIVSLYCHYTIDSQPEEKTDARRNIQHPRTGPLSYSPIPGRWHSAV